MNVLIQHFFRIVFCHRIFPRKISISKEVIVVLLHLAKRHYLQHVAKHAFQAAARKIIMFFFILFYMSWATYIFAFIVFLRLIITRDYWGKIAYYNINAAVLTITEWKVLTYFAAPFRNHHHFV